MADKNNILQEALKLLEQQLKASSNLFNGVQTVSEENATKAEKKDAESETTKSNNADRSNKFETVEILSLEGDDVHEQKYYFTPKDNKPKQGEKKSNNFLSTNTDTCLDNRSRQDDSTNITRFIPPHSNKPKQTKYLLQEYTPSNPLIKSIKIISTNQDSRIFPESNIFMRERRALLHKTVSNATPASYYSLAPRYSQMSRPQLAWYLYWRQNARNGIFLNTDLSYIILYAYELVSAEENEDKNSCLDMLTELLIKYEGSKNTGNDFPIMMCNLICDFAVIHGLNIPSVIVEKYGSKVLGYIQIPELFTDLSYDRRRNGLNAAISHISMYDYKRSRFYPENSSVYDEAMPRALDSIITNEISFEALTAFTNGAYGLLTVERRPFSRMVNIVNKNVYIEVAYFQISNITPIITDAMRYSENRLREHLGVKNKLHITAVNPALKSAIDEFFDAEFPAKATQDGRRRNKEKQDTENEFNELYDIPKGEISTEHALEIERLSWDTTKKLTEAFTDEAEDDGSADISEGKSQDAPEKPLFKDPFEPSVPDLGNADSEGNTFNSIKAEVGELADFITLCLTGSISEQREFARSVSMTQDELADRINEAAVNIVGDIIIEEIDGTYEIIEDYKDLF